MVMGVSGNYKVHLDFLFFVLGVQINGGCWLVMASCDFLQCDLMFLLKPPNFKFKHFYSS
jgi:hypothetical protein